jgi:tRNA threonylcarbamoyladenosine dehydratase
MADHERRFGSLNRLYGLGATDILRGSHAVVVGVGGVGSWAAEALARSSVGCITLIDMDHVAESNVNRQIQATDDNLGKSKIRALAERIQSFAPACNIHLIDDFLTPDNAAEIFTSFPTSERTVILDCCDQTAAKVSLVIEAKKNGLPCVLAGSAGGKCQPWKIHMADLRDSTNDALLSKVRYTLRKQHGFSKTKKMSVPVFFSDEQVIKAEICDPGSGLNCAGYGSSVTVTATMGMQMAAWAIGQFLNR